MSSLISAALKEEYDREIPLAIDRAARHMAKCLLSIRHIISGDDPSVSDELFLEHAHVVYVAHLTEAARRNCED